MGRVEHPPQEDLLTSTQGNPIKHFLIKYVFKSGTREAWHLQIQQFISSLDNDPELKGRISYRCMKERDGSGYYHLAMLVEPARADANDVRLGFIEQFAVIAKGLRSAKSLGGRRAAFLIRVGNGDDLDLGHVEPNSIEAMAVVASAGVADDTHAVFGRHVWIP